MVIGRTIHLSGATRAEFLADPEWVAHEQVHLRQFREQGFWLFLARYLWESARVGYWQNQIRSGSSRRSPPTRAGSAVSSFPVVFSRVFAF